MKITDVKTYEVANSGKIIGTASITLDECLVIKDLKIMSGSNGNFVSMPSRKTKNGEYADIVFPITKDFRMELQEAILNKFNETADEVEEQTQYITLPDDVILPF